MVEPEPISGMLVGSNVRLSHLLGRGGMGSIWVAEHLSLQIDVAVKFLSPELASLPEAKARFEREAAAAAQLKNRHVVQIFDRGVTEQGLPYIVMELLVGEDLGKHVERLGPRPLAEVVAIVVQMARALASAHSRGIVHRDIKPENVFLIDAESDLFVKLLDFGIVKRTEDRVANVTSANVMMGTPHFMSPEQLLNPRDVDFRADLWSVGVVTYVALTGVLPFDGDTIGALCVVIKEGSFRPVTKFGLGLPTELDRWFERAFERDPVRRFGSIQEMASALALAAGLSQPRMSSSPSFPGITGAEASLGWQSHITPQPVSVDPVLEEETRRLEASISGRQATQNRQVLTLLLVVGISMVSSAATTLLFLGPQSFAGLYALTMNALSGRVGLSASAAGSSAPAEHAAWLQASQPRAAQSAPHSAPGAAPLVSPVERPPDEAVEIQASRPEGWTPDAAASAIRAGSGPAAPAQGRSPTKAVPPRHPRTPSRVATERKPSAPDASTRAPDSRGDAVDVRSGSLNDGPDYGL